MYICDSIANSQRMPPETERNGATAKVRILVESVIMKIFTDNIVIPNEMSTSLLILC